VLIRCRRLGRQAAAILAALTLCAVVAQPASAQGLFDALFGNIRARPSLPPQATPFADPFGPSRDQQQPSADIGGPSAVYCVRTCDGRFFPLQRQANPVELCRSFCPASNTAVFHGSKIDTAVGPRGMRYADLEHAFLYRQRVVDNCTCNGRDPFGLARIDVKEDATLRPGDIVATNDGLTTVRNPKTGEFTPVGPASKLSNIKVTRAAPPPKVARVADEPLPRQRRNAQAAR